MRIIGGVYRHIKLERVHKASTRETADMVKEAMFNSLSPYLYNAFVLDLFAGSGSLGLEALSRGSQMCLFNDVDNDCCRTIDRNILKLIPQPKYEITNLDYLSFLAKNTSFFDLILLDPPYNLRVMDDLLPRLRFILNPGGIIACEVHKDYSFPYFDYIVRKEKIYGSKKMIILQLPSND